MNPGDAGVLFEAETLRLIDELSADTTSADLVKTVGRLRAAGHPLQRVHHALEQVRLRRKAVAKFGAFAENMLFTEAGLEQATRLQVAAHHAGRFRAAGIDSVADLGCGIGADSMAFAALGMTVLAVEQDPLTAAVASYNLASFNTVSVEVGDLRKMDLSGVAGLWLDPARRTASGKLTRPEDWSPTLTEAFSLAETRPTGIKLAPGMDRTLIPGDAEAQWVSVSGDVVEMVLWWGALRRPEVGRSALVITDSASYEMTAPEDTADAEVGALGRILYEPDGAIIRARLIGDLARSLGGTMIDPTIAYFCTADYHPTPFAAAFEVSDSFPFTIKALSQFVRDNDIGTVEIKKRGVDVDPAELRRALPLRGSAEVTIILTRVASEKTAIVAKRLGQKETPRNQE